MKRIISFFTAALLFAGLCSCNEDDTDIAPENTVTEIIAENTAESASDSSLDSDNAAESRKVYYSDEFRDINVRTIQSYDEPPCEIESYDLKNIDFGERLPICNRAENVDYFYHNKEHLQYQNGMYVQIQRTDIVTDQPSKGRIVSFRIIDGKVYFFVEYGSSPQVRSFFEWAFFRYDLNSRKLEELYSWSSDDINKVTCGCVLKDNELFYCEKIKEDISVKIVDLGTKEERTVLETKTESEEIFLQMIDSMEASLLGGKHKDEIILETIESISYDPVFHMYLYDGQSDSFKETDSSFLGYEVEGEYYNISTRSYDFKVKDDDEIMGSPIYSDDKYMIFYRGYGIDTFDLEKKERYITSLDGYNIREVPAVYDGKIIINCNSVKLLLSDYGIVYTVLEKGEYRQFVMPDGVAVLETTQGEEKLYIIK